MDGRMVSIDRWPVRTCAPEIKDGIIFFMSALVVEDYRSTYIEVSMCALHVEFRQISSKHCSTHRKDRIEIPMQCLLREVGVLPFAEESMMELSLSALSFKKPSSTYD